MVIKVPVLFLVFNRLDITKQVFEEIKKAKPKKLFIAADGPRNKMEKKKTDAVRKYILDNIDWSCEVKTLFRTKNLGCGKAVSNAITWFFDNVNMGIILEDDCLPSQSFFPFCEELLKKYKNNEKIMHISGFNPVSIKKEFNEDYFFSNSPSVWGWATWKRAWEKYDFEMKSFAEFKKLKKIDSFGFNKKMTHKKLENFNLVFNKKIDTWDGQWGFAILNNRGFCISPYKNLIKNIGFGVQSTHNFGSGKRFLKINLEKVNFPMVHPNKINLYKKYDLEYFNFFNRSFFKKIIDLIKLF